MINNKDRDVDIGIHFLRNLSQDHNYCPLK